MTDRTEAKDPYLSEPVNAATAFSSFRFRNFRLMAASSLIANTGYSMKYTALIWLVLSLTGSAAEVGLMSALLFLPMLVLSMHAGVLADRYSDSVAMRISTFARRSASCCDESYLRVQSEQEPRAWLEPSVQPRRRR